MPQLKPRNRAAEALAVAHQETAPAVSPRRDPQAAVIAAREASPTFPAASVRKTEKLVGFNLKVLPETIRAITRGARDADTSQKHFVLSILAAAGVPIPQEDLVNRRTVPWIDR